MKTFSLILTTLLLSSSCTNFGTVEQPLTGGGNGGGGNGQTGSKLVISNVTTSTGQNSTTVVNVVFRANPSDPPISRFCRVGSTQSATNLPCSLRLEWKEANQKSKETIIVARGVSAPLETVQSYLVTASAPSVFEDEIPKGTPVQVSVIGSSQSNAALEMDPFTIRKGLNTLDPGDIEDELGNVLYNIFEYVCYDKSAKALEVKSRKATLEGVTGTTQQPQSVTALLASNFCAQGITDNIEGYENTGGAGQSSESFYYNLSVPSTQKGLFNLSNEAYECPVVLENLDGSRTTPKPFGPTVYALATNVSKEFPVPVEAPSVLGRDNDPDSGPTSCILTGQEASEPMPGSSTSISSRCIGFAKLPNEDGSCPSFKDKNGLIVPTYPLKRLVFDHGYRTDADGKVKEETRAIDIVYVINRPVRTNNPSSTATIAGPAPCNQSYFDHAGVTGAGIGYTPPTETGPLEVLYNSEAGLGIPVYRGRNRSEWNITNVDGIHFPAIDNFQAQSCGTALPVYSFDSESAILAASFATSFPGSTQLINLGGSRNLSMNRLYVRPKDAIERRWTVDTTFKACAPLAQPFQDAPIHFAKTSTGDVAWCSERYPTQNDGIEFIDDIRGNTITTQARPSYVTNFTSHTVKKSASAQCSASLVDPMPAQIKSPLGAAACTATSPEFVRGAAFHPDSLRVDLTDNNTAVCADETCDRTIVGLGQSNARVPLLAPPQDVEALLRQSKTPKSKSDFSYICSIENDNIGGKNGQSPSGGCCDTSVVQLPKGLGPLDPSTTGHLEPDIPCQAPAY